MQNGMARFSFISPFAPRICLSLALSTLLFSLLYASFRAFMHASCHCGKLFVKNILTPFDLVGSKLAFDLPFAFFFIKPSSVCLICVMRERT